MTWRLTSLLLATCCCSYLVDLSLAHSGIGCFVPGECVNGTSNGVSHESSSADCLNACKESAFCNEFTFYGAEQICVMFETCPGVSADNCGDCVSGEAECGDQQCDIDGACVDSLVGLNEAHSKDECISQCQDNAACLWWTFNAEESLCEQLSGCDHIDPECEGCVSGETSCKAKGKSVEQREEGSSLLIIYKVYVFK